MISEALFVQNFSSLWKLVTPTMDGFIRRLNIGLYNRDYEPMTSTTAPSRRSFINELAFEVFCRTVRAAQRAEPMPAVRDVIEVAIPLVREVAARAALDGDYDTAPSPAEYGDVSEQVRRLCLRLCAPGNHQSIVLKPKFPGCGIVDNCEGDVLIGDALFEIKAGDRFFRAVDVRQLVTYFALNYASQKYTISSVGLVNPRVGISWEMEIGEVCFQISGRDTTGLMGELLYAVSSGGISR